MSGHGGTSAGGYNDGIALRRRHSANQRYGGILHSPAPPPPVDTASIWIRTATLPASPAAGNGTITLIGNTGTGTAVFIPTLTATSSAHRPATAAISRSRRTASSFGMGTSISTTGNILIEPYSAGTAVNIAGASTGLGITTTYLGYLSGASYTFGNANDTGTLTAAAASWAAPVSFITKSTGGIDVTGTQTGAGNATISFTGPTTLGYAGTDVTTNKRGDYVQLGGDAGGEQHDQQRHGADHFRLHGERRLQPDRHGGDVQPGRGVGRQRAAGAVSLTSANGLSLPSISASSIFAETTGAANLTVTGQLTASGTEDADCPRCRGRTSSTPTAPRS